MKERPYEQKTPNASSIQRAPRSRNALEDERKNTYNRRVVNEIGQNPIRRRLAAFRYAFRGVAHFLIKGVHARIHLALATAAIALGFALHITRAEWLAVILAIGLVLSAEAFNSALEELADAVHPERHPGIGRAKDLAAGAVLLAAIAAAVVGAVIFLPRLLP
ncbi:MAG: diacylglycerol kinase family protein [Kiritimatiellae bacterium]|nr:diacylglycerol kinase family protein [Kiritimatiellia bacterium]